MTLLFMSLTIYCSSCSFFMTSKANRHFDWNKVELSLPYKKAIYFLTRSQKGVKLGRMVKDKQTEFYFAGYHKKLLEMLLRNISFTYSLLCNGENNRIICKFTQNTHLYNLLILAYYS